MVLAVVLEQVEAVAKPLLLPVLKPPPGPPTPPPNLVRAEIPARTILGGDFEEVQGLFPSLYIQFGMRNPIFVSKLGKISI